MGGARGVPKQSKLWLCYGPVSQRGMPWGTVIKEVFDGLVYSLLTAGTFGWLWPK